VSSAQIPPPYSSQKMHRTPTSQTPPRPLPPHRVGAGRGGGRCYCVGRSWCPVHFFSSVRGGENCTGHGLLLTRWCRFDGHLGKRVGKYSRLLSRRAFLHFGALNRCPLHKFLFLTAAKKCTGHQLVRCPPHRVGGGEGGGVGAIVSVGLGVLCIFSRL